MVTSNNQSLIHPQAIIEEGASIGKNVSIGPWSYISKDVVIGDNCVINSHVVIKGPTKIGEGNKFFQFASIGEDCQDLKYAGELTELIIGDNNVFRESCTVHRGTIQDNSLTQIGSNNLFMAYTHVAHDCIVGSHCILANNASIAGHVHVGDYAILGGMTGVHQFCHIGAHSFVAANSLILKDIPPYLMVSGQPASPFGLNSEGLKRRGFDKEVILTIKRAYKEVYRKGLNVNEALEKVAALADDMPELTLFAEFIKNSSRGIAR
ncbi:MULTISPECIES: acyl-ACP--UDP-N-acetylglucosamine O-acyltransferase [unclassified Colwellia]|jgi:UDP-N-acetylglucosamine acyltransferase|uniref:acyl-ACP--UDP-N-acetylglucosamine O-acyltransferase n=1 Tax=unclassified Colwellia TaxID=196834 RepID=UPI0015F4EAD1|nr:MULTISPECIES: acyl-ACP--UDP-N-acetylglucosamine O-acyltransferase [unclassified Colwellia]MBA6252774.1 acyl-ACP--UDP-N-acetylglucosamine O-acyltransferase [Colwellia sp. MB3u-55]MBA6396873.1 acyl-ACP--UDP-N-acetylglucosamine O-acyltransferase [Colwellia sp. BRX10-4]